jgi:hypothetical protein
VDSKLAAPTEDSLGAAAGRRGSSGSTRVRGRERAETQLRALRARVDAEEASRRSIRADRQQRIREVLAARYASETPTDPELESGP